MPASIRYPPAVRAPLICLSNLLLNSSTLAQPDSLWRRTFRGAGRDSCLQIAATSDGGFVLAGHVEPFGPVGPPLDFWMTKAGPDPTIDTDPNLNLHPSASPSTPICSIRQQRSIATSTGKHGSPSRCDLLGRQTVELVNRAMPAGGYRMNWSCPECTSGLHVVGLRGKGARVSQRALLLR